MFVNENRDKLIHRFELCENIDEIKINSNADGIRAG